MSKPLDEENMTPRFAYDGLDRTIHEKARLCIMTSLASNPKGLLFNDLKSLCGLTDGNLSRHIKILYDAGLVEVWKGFRKNRPQTLCRISEDGRRKFLEYMQVLQNVVQDAWEAARPASMSPATLGSDYLEGFSPA